MTLNDKKFNYLLDYIESLKFSIGQMEMRMKELEHKMEDMVYLR